MSQLKDLLVQLRRDRDLSQEELAARCGLSVRTISDLERGIARSARKATAELLAEAFGLTGAQRQAFLAVARGRVAPAAASSPPPGLPGQGAPSSSHPAPDPSLYGREELIREVNSLLLDSGGRIVTLLGPGGVGKTRIALEIARRASHTWPDGALVVRLETLRSPDGILPAIARELHLRDGGDLDVATAIGRALGGQHRLLVLDNLEQIVEGAGDLVKLVQACPALAVLTTSRVPLRVGPERLYPVPALAVPAPRLALDDLTDAPAVELFLERVRDGQPGWTPGARDLAVVAEVCRRLDGLPLAVELAARRVRLLGVTGLLERPDRLGLLSRGPRDAPERHRSLRDTLQWSHDLLEENARIVFRRLAVFAGPFSVEDAEAVCPADDQHLDVLTALDDLLDACMIVNQGPSGHLGMQQMVQEYAAELFKDCDERDRVALRHAGYVASLTERARPATVLGVSGEDVVWPARRDDVTSALRACVALGVPEPAVRIIVASWRQCVATGDMAELLGLARQVLELPGDVDPVLRAHAVKAAATLSSQLGLGAEAAAWCDEALALFSALGEHHEVAACLNNRGGIEWFQGHLEAAETWWRRCLAEAEGHEIAWLAATAEYNLVLTTMTVDPASALVLAEQCLTRSVVLGRPELIGCAFNGRGLARARLEDHAGAVQDFVQAGRTFLQAGDLGMWLCRILDNLAVSLSASGATILAVTQFGAAEAIRRRMNLGVNQLEREHHRVRDAILSAGGTEVLAAWDRGLHASSDAAAALLAAADAGSGPTGSAHSAST